MQHVFGVRMKRIKTRSRDMTIAMTAKRRHQSLHDRNQTHFRILDKTTRRTSAYNQRVRTMIDSRHQRHVTTQRHQRSRGFGLEKIHGGQRHQKTVDFKQPHAARRTQFRDALRNRFLDNHQSLDGFHVRPGFFQTKRQIIQDMRIQHG